MTYQADLLKEVQYLKGVGPARAAALARLGIKTVQDMLFYFPRAWVDRSNIKPINKVTLGEKETVKGVVTAKGTKRVRPNLSITSVLIQDEKGYITGVWYNQPYMEKVFKKGDTVIFHGRVEIFRGNFQMSTPEYEILQGIENRESGIVKDKTIKAGTDGAVTKPDARNPIPDEDLLNVNRIVPIYPLTENLSQKQFRKIVKFAIDNYLKLIEEQLPDKIKIKYGLIELKKAIENVHFPDDFELLSAGKRRLIFDEFFYLQFALAVRKSRIKERTAPVFKPAGNFDVILRGLPFTLTGAQQRVLQEIKSDLSSGRPMNRLIQGDVGSGKTVVALLASALAADSGAQAAIMAPTEILASQHMRTISSFVKGTGIRVELLLGGARKKERDAILSGLKDGGINIIIGTHSLIQEDVVFKNLGLITIDEQHRFGVLQRARLAEKGGEVPHTLIMTATPIPRTLSMTVYGDTDISVIDELPPGRKPVRTVLFADNENDRLYRFIDERLKEGAQIYAVYPLVQESEKLDLKSAIEMEKEWKARFTGRSISLVHGQMPKEERDQAMLGFKEKKTQILVATTVIEVGIDVPNASVMVIEHAERFGLSQLHQLRGRVGRGEVQSYCILIGDPGTEDGMKRLNIMTSTQDGFRIAEEDLAIRGPGEFMGVRQHGLPEFRIANILKDKDIMLLSREAAFSIISGDCDINHSEKEQLVRIIKQRFGPSFDLINIG
jgi:ATP-dependent DNA helicase RecG